ncbi:MAG TPA: hypothetical protein DCP92_14765 [Nitrospiraceae bacterium]|nr:hypothetical protein [Nitrospiraceae bacterium]
MPAEPYLHLSSSGAGNSSAFRFYDIRPHYISHTEKQKEDEDNENSHSFYHSSIISHISTKFCKREVDAHCVTTRMKSFCGQTVRGSGRISPDTL